MEATFVLLGAFAVFSALALTLVAAYASLAPWVPTRRRDLERINRFAELPDGGVFYEAGCGTAHVAGYIARRNPGARVVGIELALPWYLLAKLRSVVRGPKNLSIEFGDACSRNYADADAVYIFGLPQTVNGKFKEKLEAELKLGARFISYSFVVRDWAGQKVVRDKPTPADRSLHVCIR